jgi:hypothetical protein
MRLVTRTKTHTELLTWTRLPGPLPDADVTVLISIEGQDEAWPGYLDDDCWHWAGNGGRVAERVLGWAPMPGGLVGVPL